MGTCKSCNKVVDDSQMKDGICENCVESKEAEVTKISGAIGYLNFFSWLILLLSFVVGGFVLSTMTYVDMPYHLAGGMTIDRSEFNIIGVVYGIAILFQGIFLSSLGFSIVYIAKIISQREKR